MEGDCGPVEKVETGKQCCPVEVVVPVEIVVQGGAVVAATIG